MPGSSDERLVRNFLAAMGQADIRSLSEMLTEDATWWLAGDLPVSGLYEGKAAIVGDFLSSAAALFEQDTLHFEVRSTLSAAGSVVAEYVGTGRGTLDGRQYRNTYCTVFECCDGQVSSVREYLDTAHVRDALYRTGGA